LEGGVVGDDFKSMLKHALECMERDEAHEDMIRQRDEAINRANRLKLENDSLVKERAILMDRLKKEDGTSEAKKSSTQLSQEN
jgi:hypothetical protein